MEVEVVAQAVADAERATDPLWFRVLVSPAHVVGGAVYCVLELLYVKVNILASVAYAFSGPGRVLASGSDTPTPKFLGCCREGANLKSNVTSLLVLNSIEITCTLHSHTPVPRVIVRSSTWTAERQCCDVTYFLPKSVRLSGVPRHWHIKVSSDTMLRYAHLHDIFKPSH